MDADPWFVDDGDIDAARALVDEAKDAELFLYPGDQHLFVDSSLRSYDAEAAALVTQRVLDFLGGRSASGVTGRTSRSRQDDHRTSVTRATIGRQPLLRADGPDARG